MKRILRLKVAFLLIGILILGSSITVCAEEVEPAGYHVYDVQDGEVSDSWYGIARGSYLKSGIAKLTEGNPGYALASGITLAHVNCDRVYVRIYLDKSDTGTGGWGTLDYWTGETHNASIATASSGQYKIDPTKYYRVRGVHSATKEDYTEATTTCTDALKFDD